MESKLKVLPFPLHIKGSETKLEQVFVQGSCDDLITEFNTEELDPLSSNERKETAAENTPEWDTPIGRPTDSETTNSLRCLVKEEIDIEDYQNLEDGPNAIRIYQETPVYLLTSCVKVDMEDEGEPAPEPEMVLIEEYGVQQGVAASAPREKMFRCSKCGRAVPSSRVQTHLLNHAGLKSLSCALCPYKTAHRGNLTNHITRMHSQAEKTLSCALCPYTTAHRSNLITHVKGVHMRAKKFLSCTKCLYRTINPYHLECHTKGHSGKMLYNCTYCPFKSAASIYLRIHTMTCHKG